MRIRKLNHSVYQLQYHIVWGTKYRRKVLKPYVRTELIKSMYKVLRKCPDWYLHEINTGDDHVHILLELPPKYTISFAIKQFKSHSNTSIKKHFKFIREIYLGRSMWSVGYFVSSVGLNEEQIRKYIRKQSKYELPKDITNEFS